MGCVTTQIWSIINNSSENICCYTVYHKYDSYSQLCSKCRKHRPAHAKHVNKWIVLRDVFASSARIKSLFWISKFENITCQTFFLYLYNLYNWLWLRTSPSKLRAQILFRFIVQKLKIDVAKIPRSWTTAQHEKPGWGGSNLSSLLFTYPSHWYFTKTCEIILNIIYYRKDIQNLPHIVFW